MEIMTTSFYSMFVNTALIQLLSNANFQQTILRVIPIRNQFNDFVSDWYVVIGRSLQNTMLMTAFLPYITFLIAFASKKLTVIKDRKHDIRNQFATKMITIQQYVNAYSGPDVTLFARYASVLNQVFVAFTYGLALPLLFPICLIGLINMYITERY